jgi:hypothetical protein
MIRKVIRGAEDRQSTITEEFYLEGLAANLPDELRTLDRWLYSEDGRATGLRDYIAAVAEHIERQLPGRGRELASAVTAAAGLDVGDWYLRCMTAPRPPGRRR